MFRGHLEIKIFFTIMELDKGLAHGLNALLQCEISTFLDKTNNAGSPAHTYTSCSSRISKLSTTVKHVRVTEKKISPLSSQLLEPTALTTV